MWWLFMLMASLWFFHNVTVASWRTTTRVCRLMMSDKFYVAMATSCFVSGLSPRLFLRYYSHVRVRCPLTTKLVSFIGSDYLMKKQFLFSFVKTFLVNFQKIHLTSRWKTGLWKQSRQRSCTSHKDTSAPNHHYLQWLFFYPDFLAVSRWVIDYQQQRTSPPAFSSILMRCLRLHNIFWEALLNGGAIFALLSVADQVSSLPSYW